jgi:peptide-methionine (S)-S-oxide reductase
MNRAKLLLVAALLVSAWAVADEPATAIFAGGCFWCMEPPFDALDGVLDTTSGYTGGRTRNPTYEQVGTQRTGHLEAVRVTYDPARIGYADLLAVYWRNIDPFDDTGQFCDKGASYRAAIFVATDAERELAEASKAAQEATLGQPIVTRILPAQRFYPAEDYHQDYYQKNPLRYKYYRFGCGRDARLDAVWSGVGD